MIERSEALRFIVLGVLQQKSRCDRSRTMFFLRILRPTTKIAAKLALHPLGTRSRFQPLLIIYTMSKTISRTSSKRKLEEDEMDTASPSTSSQTKKKQKAPLKKSEPTLPDTKSAIEEDSQKTLVGRDATEQPKNTKLPDIITFPPPTPGCVKIAAWNVAGMKACQGKVRDSLILTCLGMLKYV